MRFDHLLKHEVVLMMVVVRYFEHFFDLTRAVATSLPLPSVRKISNGQFNLHGVIVSIGKDTVL